MGLPGTHYDIYDASGRIVKEGISTSDGRATLLGLERGVYVSKAETRKAKTTLKLVNIR